ncbi:class II aldolase/adducin N-terminal [Paraphoma chrysanthemicola]|nr:class II aldolase/adducin N-terminal [Paraphoma chrysanthemicola]
MSPPSATSMSHADTIESSFEAPSAAMKGIEFPHPPTFTDRYKEREYQKGRLALAFRLFAKYGFDEGVAGHITLRDPVEATSFWVNPMGIAWPTLKASDLILVNKEGNVVDGGKVRLLNTAAYMIHHAVHTARPEINAVAHSHSIYGRTFSTSGRPLDITTQDSCAFHNDLALYTSFRGIVLGADEGVAIAKALGRKKAAVLQNHGLLTCGTTIEETVFWFASLEKCCHVQLMSDAAAGGRGYETVKISEQDAAFTYKSVGTSYAGWFSATPAFDMMARESGEEYQL